MSYGTLQNDKSQRAAIQALLNGTATLPADALFPGSVARSVVDELRDLGAPVTRWGVDITGATDSTAAMLAAIASGKHLTVPNGAVILVSSTLNITACKSLTCPGIATFKAANASWGGAAVIQAGNTTDFGDWWSEGCISGIKIDGNGQPCEGFYFINTRLCHGWNLRADNTQLSAFKAWAGYGLKLSRLSAHSGHYPDQDSEAAGFWMKGHDHQISDAEFVHFPIGVFVDDNAANNTWINIHPWGTYNAAQVQMKIGFLICGEGNEFLMPFADSPGRSAPGSANSRSNGGYGFYITTNAFKTKLICPKIYLGNSGDTLPLTGTIQPIHVDQDNAVIFGPNYRSAIGGVAFADPAITYDSSYRLSASVMGAANEVIVQPHLMQTFTPELLFGGANVDMTYAFRLGRAWRITNDLVEFRITIRLSAKGSSTGNATITGLPFTTYDEDNSSAVPCSAYAVSMATSTGIVATVGNNSSIITLRRNTDHAAISDTSFGNNTNLTIEGRFRDNSLAGL